MSKEADIWAVGCIGFELLTGSKLFDSMEMIESYIRTLDLSRTKLASVKADPDIVRMISACLTVDRDRRPSVWFLQAHLHEVKIQN